MNRGRWLLLTACLTGVALFLAFGPDEQAVIRRSAEWRESARTHVFASLAAFLITEVVLVALSVPVGIWLTVLGGFLFGTWVGAAVVNVGSTLGAVLAFLSARYVFADAIRRAAEARPRLNRSLTALDRGLHGHGAYYVLLLRLTPVFPFWLLNLGLGLTRLRFRDYWWGTQLGTLPATLVVANAGASLAEITTARDVLSPRVLGALCLMPLVPFVLHHTLGRFVANPDRQRRGGRGEELPRR